MSSAEIVHAEHCDCVTIGGELLVAPACEVATARSKAAAVQKNTPIEIELWGALTMALHASACYNHSCCGGRDGHEKILRDVRATREKYHHIAEHFPQSSAPDQVQDAVQAAIKQQPAEAEAVEKAAIKQRIVQWGNSFFERAFRAVDQGIPVSMCDEAGCAYVSQDGVALYNPDGTYRLSHNGTFRITFEIGAFSSPFPLRSKRDAVYVHLQNMADCEVSELHLAAATLHDYFALGLQAGSSSEDARIKLTDAARLIYKATRPVK